MLKPLLKKQFLELNAFYYQNRKTGKNRSRSGIVLSILFFLVIYVAFVFLFYEVVDAFAPLLQTQMGWLYYAMMGILAIAFGTFGSVFHTYAGLYHAKDNDLLLAMPIRPSMILLVRMIGVAAMGFLYEAIVMVPALLRGFQEVPFTVSMLVGGLVVFLSVGVCVTVLSCFLGWLVALLSGKFRNKSFLTVLFFLVFMGAYYYVFYQSYGIVQSILLHSEQIGSVIRTWFYPFYVMGCAAWGNGRSMVLFVVMVGVLFAITYTILSKTFLKIATNKGDSVKAVYRERKMKAAGLESALVRKEYRRFVGSPTYMLNCGLGIFFMPIGAVFCLIYMGKIRPVLDMMGEWEHFLPIVAAAAICIVATMNDMTAPSVSLEGKHVWILQSFPVSTKKIFDAKQRLQWAFTMPPALFLGICLVIALRIPVISALCLILFVAAFLLFYAAAGLVLNLLMPNLKWTNETVPIKQSMPVMLSLFGGWAIVVLFAVGGYFLTKTIPSVLYLLLGTALLAAINGWLNHWLRTKGTAIFENL